MTRYHRPRRMPRRRTVRRWAAAGLLLAAQLSWAPVHRIDPGTGTGTGAGAVPVTP